MSERRDELELRFEKALVEVLAHEHDLEVRHREDHIDRRRQGVATLNFTFHYGKDGENAKVVITVDGAEKFSNVLPVDFRNRKGIERSAENCDQASSVRIARLLDPAGSGGQTSPSTAHPSGPPIIRKQHPSCPGCSG